MCVTQRWATDQKNKEIKIFEKVYKTIIKDKQKDGEKKGVPIKE